MSDILKIKDIFELVEKNKEYGLFGKLEWEWNDTGVISLSLCFLGHSNIHMAIDQEQALKFAKWVIEEMEGKEK